MEYKQISEIMKPVNILQVNESAPKLIGKDWMLIASGTADNFNAMTASWGGMGEMWYRPAVFVFVRPQRYTFGFMEQNDCFTISFLGEEYRKALTVMGKKSGRDTDKVAETGLTPVQTDSGMAFAESRIVMECRKMYAGMLEAGSFTDETIIPKAYPDADFHKMYVAEIVRVWQK